MDNRRTGFLRKNERALLTSSPDGATTASEAQLDPNTQAKLKYKLRTGPGSATGLGIVVRTVRQDFEHIERFWLREMADEGGKYTFQDVVLPANRDELERLRTLLDEWLEWAETDFTGRERTLLREHAHPLWKDLTGLPDDVDPAQYIGLPTSNDDAGDEGLDGSQRELALRWDALQAVLQDEELRDILDWIRANPKSKLPKGRAYKGITWRQVATSELYHEYELITQFGDWAHCYSISERGAAVYATLDSFESTEDLRDLPVDERYRQWLALIERQKYR